MITVPPDATKDRPTIFAAGRRVEHRVQTHRGLGRLCVTHRPEVVCACGAYKIRWPESGEKA